MTVDDAAAIRKTVDRFIQAYNAGDLDRIQDIFHDDLIDMSAGASTRSGEAARQYFLSRVTEAHAKFKPTLEVTLEEITVAGDWAYGRGHLVVTLVPKRGGETTYIRQRFLEIWRRDSRGNWKLSRIMDNSEQP